ncbi:GldM family protein [Pontibacter sp. G13]|uniref:type IX secretion system motor protein PorM/GldM n=1 Tax=Pontibacter sp. G13 TaxID=3074898 RepID=UPI002889F6B8|nr:GldM family protein [Pontibacter sp. G13]WNJ16245.1 GldM family protein [Pontibacter sp. G13]
MASGNLPPRQKMINMMYLVLLAILALNVSSEVLDAFVQIRGNLNHSASHAQTLSQDYVLMLKSKIQDEIEFEGNHKNEGLLDTLDLIQNKTQALIKALDGHVSEMEEIATWDEELQDYRKKDELEVNYQYWMGLDEDANERRGNGKAFDLRDELDAYGDFIHGFYASIGDSALEEIEPELMQDPKPDPKDPGKRWEQYTFQGPVVGNLATLEALKLHILNQEKELLEQFRKRLGVHQFAPDKVMAISMPQSQVVVAGTPFKTRLFVGMGSSQIQPDFKSGSGQLNLEDDGNSAWLTVMASGASIRNGAAEGKQRYQATVLVPKTDGSFDTLTVSEEFTVRKPEVVLRSRVIQKLYRECANEVQISIPALDEYEPVVSVSSGSINQRSNSKDWFLIKPRGNQCKVNVKAKVSGSVIPVEELDYRVLSTPKPTVQAKIGNKTLSGFNSIKKGQSLKIRIIPEEAFAEMYPKDANYRVKTVEIYLKKGIGPPRLIGQVPASNVNARNGVTVRMPSAVRDAKAGDQLFIKLKDVERRNFEGRFIPERTLSESECTIPLTVQ